MKRNKGVSMITLIITIIVIIILAAIAFVGMDDAIGSAQYEKFASEFDDYSIVGKDDATGSDQYAKFSSEFGDYSTKFTSGAVTKVQESLVLAGKVANKAQIVYCAARGVKLSEFDKVLNGVVTPGGYTSEKFQTAIKDATGATYVLASATTPCYEIKDDVMNEYKGKSFYGNANGQETHWVTAMGKVFTLPGYPRTVDGEERMYISSDLYYVPNDGDMIHASELEPVKAVKIGDEASGATIGSQEYTDAADHASSTGETGGEEGGDPAVLAAIKVGDFVEYTPDTAVSSSIKWRVWAIEGNDIVIMPTSPVGSLRLGYESTDTTTDEKIEECFNNYKTAVAQIEAECAKYGSSKAKSVRSLTIEDLEDEKVSTLATQKKNYTGGLGYGTIKTYESGSYFAAKYNETTEENEILESLKSAPLTVKQTYYYSSSPGWKTLGTSSDTYGTLLGNTWGWLASSCVGCRSSYARFGVHGAGGGDVYARILLDSDGYTYWGSLGVRPLVSLSSMVLEGEGDSSDFATWTIKN